MFVHFFWILTNFLYVCQSISWLTNLLKLGQYGDISCPGWDIFLKYFGDISGIFWQYFQINANCLYVCQSVSWLTSLQILNKCRDISCSERDIFLKFVWDIFGMFALISAYFWDQNHNFLIYLTRMPPCWVCKLGFKRSLTLIL